MSGTAPIPLYKEDGPRVGARGWAALVVLMLPVLLVSVDNTVLAFAIPEISLALQPSGAQQLWIIDIYSLVLAGLLVTMGVLGDRFGRRRMLLIGATGFAVVSAFAAFAPTAGLLIAARAALGLFGAMLMPSTLSLLRSIFQNRDQRRLAIAIWASAFSAGSALGPIVGGFLLEHFAWGSVFLIAVPVLIPLLIGGFWLLPESSDPNPGQIDPIGILLSMAALVPIVYAIKAFAVDGPSITASGLVVFGLVTGFLFVRRQQRAVIPMLDMSLFRRGGFSGAILVNLLSVVALVGFLYFVSQQLQLVIGLSPMVAGLALVPGMAAMIIAGLSVVPVSRRVPPHIVVPLGLVLSALGYVLVAATAELNSVPWLLAAFVVLGLGIGAAETISNELILAHAPPEKAGAASAVSETAYELGAVLGTAILGGIITAFYRGALVIPDRVPAASAEQARETLAGAYVVAHDLPQALGQSLWDAATDAFGSGVVTTSIIGALLVAIAIAVAATTLRPSQNAVLR
ncbi:putative efflux MFS permease [Microbacterium esteraromaticum]|uniref:Putative efflux MFS permease n=1 Tax=Microbacterium esteraromaticum TaxID=57043 RepID=A0A1R4JMM9_9MICO|nr:MFS transporter [Microbacterium esteraromaticum]SJN33247.1 putative efflux MFS permease [Microbacterium esteraromaticum]